MTGEPPPGPLAAGSPRPALVAEVRRVLQRLPQQATIVVGVSGGPDSTALAFLVPEAREDLTVVLAHVRHGLRDDRRDLAAAQRQASFLGLELQVADVDVQRSGRGIEDAARQQRYAALRRVARDHGAGWLAVAHTADDQAETVLMRMARGTGIPGLAGMSEVRGDIIRPLLRVRRVDVHRFVEFEGLPVVHDPTNQDRRLTRNLIRHDVMPLLAGVGGDVIGALGRLADLAREDADTLDAVARERMAEIVTRCGPVIAVRRDDLAAERPAVARRIVREAITEVRASVDPPSSAEVDALRRLDGAQDISGVRASAAGGWWAVAPDDLPEPDPVQCAVPGRATWSPVRWAIIATSSEAEVAGADGPQQLGLVATWTPTSVRVRSSLIPPGGDPSLGQVVLGGFHQVPSSLTLRARLPGDRIRTTGGTRKLQDVMVDAGLPRALRDQIPVVAAGMRILWVPGLAVDADAHAAGAEEPQLHLYIQRPGR